MNALVPVADLGTKVALLSHYADVRHRIETAQPRIKRVPYDPVAFAEDWKNNVPIPTIRERYGLTKPAPHHKRHRLGLKARTNRGVKHRLVWNEDTEIQFCADWLANVPLKVICAGLEISTSAADDMRKHLRLPPRRREETNKVMRLYVTATEEREAARAARLRGLSTSAWAREIIRDHLAGRLKSLSDMNGMVNITKVQLRAFVWLREHGDSGKWVKRRKKDIVPTAILAAGKLSRCSLDTWQELQRLGLVETRGDVLSLTVAGRHFNTAAIKPLRDQ